MTTNQLTYWQNEELKRSNAARETETVRSNKAKEEELKRTNQANEAIRSQSNEIARQNKVDELTVRKLIEQEANRIKADGVTNQAQANRIAANRVNNDFTIGKLTARNAERQIELNEDESFARQVGHLAPFWKTAASVISTIF